MQRREFIKQASAILLVLGTGEWKRLSQLPDSFPGRPVLRFAVASDGHYGQPKTEYRQYFAELVNAINREHEKARFDFCVINGDIVHDDKSLFPEAKQALDGLAPPYFVSQGNHDHVNGAEWEAIWKMPLNIDRRFGKNSILIGTSSDEKGTYLCPDLSWFTSKLEEHRSQRNVFVFVHINPVGQTKNAVKCPEFADLLSRYPNVKAVFNGHDHDQDDIKLNNSIPYIFDAHFGGNWGTDYRGFRVVELRRDNSLLTYVLNPSQKIKEQTLPV